jgi:hypothetical protein
VSYDNNASRLQQIHIASPCSAAWSEMSGDHRSRHCAHCNKRVYNLSQMSSEEALAMLDQDAGGVCIQIYRRRDGTVLTSDCPKGRQSVARRVYRQIAQTMTVLAAAQAFACAPAKEPSAKTSATHVKRTLARKAGRLVEPVEPAYEAVVTGGMPAIQVAPPEPVVALPGPHVAAVPPVAALTPSKAQVDQGDYARHPIDVFYGR